MKSLSTHRCAPPGPAPRSSTPSAVPALTPPIEEDGIVGTVRRGGRRSGAIDASATSSSRSPAPGLPSNRYLRHLRGNWPKASSLWTTFIPAAR
jgi:hypothetical protein